jgi:serine protease AprX
VASAGNGGRNADGGRQFGAITAPGNAPWVLTVGASSHMGTASRDDDAAAAFSSHGPTAVDFTAKPDLLAPGVGIESLSDPTSRMYATRPTALLAGTVATSYLPYLSLSGTSMATPVVTGTVALMLQANPALTPNAVKAILQYAAQPYAGYDALTQGAGFLDAAGAVALARSFADPSGVQPSSPAWSRQIIWANRRILGGQLNPAANAWATDVMWGEAQTPAGETVEWGLAAETAPNVVWGVRCGGDDCDERWSLATAGSEVLGTTVVWGTNEGDTVVWGTDSEDTVVWGTDGGDTVVWGTDTVVWGTEDLDTVVWGTGNDGHDTDHP